MKTAVVFAILSLVLLFSSNSATQTRIVLLGQISIDEFVNNKAVIQTNDCRLQSSPVIDSVKVEVNENDFSVREVLLNDGFSSAESVFINKNSARAWHQLDQSTCVSSIVLVGHGVGTLQAKHSLVKIWAYRQ